MNKQTFNDGRLCVCTSDGALFAFKCNQDDEETYVNLSQTACKQYFKHRYVSPLKVHKLMQPQISNLLQL